MIWALSPSPSTSTAGCGARHRYLAGQKSTQPQVLIPVLEALASAWPGVPPQAHDSMWLGRDVTPTKTVQETGEFDQLRCSKSGLMFLTAGRPQHMADDKALR